MRLSILLIVISVSFFNCKIITLDDEQAMATIPEDIELIKIPAGIYISGEGKTEDYINYDYLMMKYPVTNSQYINYLIEANSLGIIKIDSLGVSGQYGGDHFWPPGTYQFADFSDNNSRNGFYSPDIYFTKWRYVENRKEFYNNHPVTHVTWFGALAYAKFYGMRLPTVTEWEKAARANSGNEYPWGDTISPNYANYRDSGDVYDNDTTPVGFFNGDNNTSNSYSPYGMYDMAGNVWEWTISRWRDSSGKIIKGGSFNSKMTSAGGVPTVYDLMTWFETAVGYLPTNTSREIGFRCVMDIDN